VAHWNIFKRDTGSWLGTADGPTAAAAIDHWFRLTDRKEREKLAGKGKDLRREELEAKRLAGESAFYEADP
jgi:hypothetical protein